MNSSLKKSGKKIEEYTADERAAIYLQSPYFIQKNKEAKEFLKRAGLPERYATRNKSGN